MSTLERAIEIAVKAHKDQPVKGTEPYIFHPLRVMLKMKTDEERITAVLHDVVEDCQSITFAFLEKEGFSAEILAALEALTRHDGEERLDAARRAKKNPIARKVKIEDVKDNLDLSRISNPTSEDFSRYLEYRKVLPFLESDQE